MQSSPNWHGEEKSLALAGEDLPLKKASSRILSFTVSQPKKKKRRKESNDVPVFWGLTTMTSPNFNPSRLTSRQQASLMSKCEALGMNIDPFSPKVFPALSPFVLDRIADEASGIVPWTQQLNAISTKKCSEESENLIYSEKENSRPPVINSRSSNKKEFSNMKSASSIGKSDNNRLDGPKSGLKKENLMIASTTKRKQTSVRIPKTIGTNANDATTSDEIVESLGKHHVNALDTLMQISSVDLPVTSSSVSMANGPTPLSTDLRADEESILKESHELFGSSIHDSIREPRQNETSMLVVNETSCSTPNATTPEIVIPGYVSSSLKTGFSKIYQTIIYKRAMHQVHTFISGDDSCCKALLGSVKGCSNAHAALRLFLSPNTPCPHRKKDELTLFLSYLLV